MSLASSDLGGEDAFAEAGLEPGNADIESPDPVAAPPAYRKQGFSIYSVMLILSFVFLLTAAILFFVDAGKY